MSKLFSDLKPRNTVQRNGFDLSRRCVFSAKCGQILPVFSQATLPDSEYRIDVKQLLRTQPLQTAAFTGFSINYDFFFVPHNYSYSSFNEFISQREDSRHVGQPSIDEVPRFNFRKFMEVLIAAASYDYLLELHYHPAGFVDMTSDMYVAIPWQYCITSSNLPTVSISLEVIRSLDMFGYGNYLPMVKRYAENTFSSLGSPESFHDFYDAVQARYRLMTANQNFEPNTIAKMLEAFQAFMSNDDYSDDVPREPFFESFPDIQPTLWPALAYNKAFYEFYRNSYYDFGLQLQVNNLLQPYDMTYDYVQLFNFDDWSDDFIQTGNWLLNTEFLRILAIFCPKNHLYKKDLFTGVLPSTQFGSVSAMFTDNDFRSLVARLNSSSYGDVTVPVRINPQTAKDGVASAYLNSSAVSTSWRFDPSLAISVLEQRRADSMQRFKERLMRAGNKVKDVFKAHGWSEPYSASESTPVFIGTFDGRLEINPVAATNSNDEIELGQLGANGLAVVNGSNLRFKCHDFGTIVGVLYIIKDVEYDAYGVERQYCLTDPFDYPYPELQNISLAPIDVLELSSYMRFINQPCSVKSDIVGYLPRFMEYKTALDKVHGEFYSAPWFPDAYGANDDAGVFSDWVCPRLDIHLPDVVSFLYQQPNVADAIFKVRNTALQSTDPFLINCYFDCMAVEPVSVIGLPI